MSAQTSDTDRPFLSQWIDLEGVANLRDVGGLPTDSGGRIRSGRLLRSDNLQTLTGSDVDRLLALGLTDVVDLRSDYEVRAEGDGPLHRRPQVRHHHFSYFQEPEASIDEAEDGSSTRRSQEAKARAGAATRSGSASRSNAPRWHSFLPGMIR